MLTWKYGRSKWPVSEALLGGIVAKWSIAISGSVDITPMGGLARVVIAAVRGFLFFGKQYGRFDA